MSGRLSKGAGAGSHGSCVKGLASISGIVGTQCRI